MLPVASFDVFDTLIARRCGEPVRLLELLEARARCPGLAAARQAADRVLGAAGRPYLLADLWREAARSLGLDHAAAARLLDLEMGLEHEQVIPIVENLSRLRDGDVLVSDTYLPADVVLSLLRTAGLRQVVALVVSNDGKHTGRIWPQLLTRLKLREHTGDNAHSDGRTPALAGLRSVLYSGANWTPAEQLLAGRGLLPLARLAREVRLANPFGAGTPQRHLWTLCCQLNFPLLYLASLWLEAAARRAGAGELLFVSRDCLLWRALHERLFPQRKCTYLYASRLCLLKPTEGYLEYFRSAWRPDRLIVDLSSTGASWARLFQRLGQRGRCRFLWWIDDYAYIAGGPRPADWLEVEVAFRSSGPGPAVGKGVEMLNYAPHGLVEDVVPLPGGGACPVLSPELEYEAALPEAAHAAFAACLEALRHYPELTSGGSEVAADLLRTLAGLISADGRLPQIYAGHVEADLAYQRRLLS